MISKLISTRTGPIIPVEMSGVIELRTQVELKDVEVIIFSQALVALQARLNEEGIDIATRNHVQIVFLSGDALELTAAGGIVGMHVEFVLYYIARIRALLETAPSTQHHRIYLMIFIEELCHAFWKSHDENAIKHKVAEVMSVLTPTPVHVKDLYNL